MSCGKWTFHPIFVRQLECPPTQEWPHPHSYRRSLNITISQQWIMGDLFDHFHLLLSKEAYDQSNRLILMFNEMLLFATEDIWQYPSRDSKFQVSKTYTFLMGEHWSHMSLNGFGTHDVSWSTNSFSGFYYKTDWTQETYLTGRISTLRQVSVSYVMMSLMNI